MTNKKSPELKELEKLSNELFSLMGTKVAPEISYDKANDTLVVAIATEEEAGLLIGRKGETLSSIQMILGIALKQRTGQWHRVVVDVSDYRQKEEAYLKDLATSAAERVKETGKAQNLYNLKPGQRRVVHLFLSDDPGISTESVGDGEERYLVVKAKNANTN